jgi:imidazolonepropionase-like amidohydrolase
MRELRFLCILWAVAAAMAPAQAPASSGFAVRAGKIFVMDEKNTVLDNAVLFVEGTKIARIALEADARIPAGMTVYDCRDRWIVPGFIDPHDHVAGALFDLNDGVWLTNPGLRTIDMLSPENDNLRRAVAGGVTTVLLIPGSGNNSSGFGTVARTAGRSQDEMVMKYPGSLKIAQAGNPERYWFGVQRSYMNFNLRQTLRKAQEYHAAWTAWEQDKSKPKPRFDITWEAFRGLFRREFVVSVHTQMFQVFSMTITMLADEFGLKVMPDHSDFDDYKATSLAVERDLPVICGPRVWWMDGRDRTVNGACASHWKGGLRKVGVNTDAPVVPQEELTTQAAMGVRYGWETLPAIAGITRVPAQALGIDDLVGTLEVGKEADFCVWTGDPIDARSHVTHTFVAGRLAYDAAAEGQRF